MLYGRLGEKVGEVVGGGVGGVVRSTLSDKMGESMVSKFAEWSVEKLTEVLLTGVSRPTFV